MDEKSWKENIEKIRKEIVPSTKEKLKAELVRAIKDLIPKQRFGIFFSGGVDSSLIALICKQANADFICYTVGIKDSPDIQWAKRIAESLKLNLKIKEYSEEELEQLFIRTAKILKQGARVDTLSVGVGAVLVACIELAKEDNIQHFFSGGGSEEIFAGYERHMKAEDKHEECWQGLSTMYARDFTRDLTIAKQLNIEILFPFIDSAVIKEAMGIDISKKISESIKKIILREIAEELGLAHDFAWRKKQAAQYGSKFDKAILKISKKNGFENKLDWLHSI